MAQATGDLSLLRLAAQAEPRAKPASLATWAKLSRGLPSLRMDALTRHTRFCSLVEEYEPSTKPTGEPDDLDQHTHKMLGLLCDKLAVLEEKRAGKRAVLKAYGRAVAELAASQVGGELARGRCCSLDEFWRGVRPIVRVETSESQQETPHEASPRVLERVSSNARPRTTHASGIRPSMRRLDSSWPNMFKTVRAPRSYWIPPPIRQQTESSASNSPGAQEARDAMDEQPRVHDDQTRSDRVVQPAGGCPVVSVAPSDSMGSVRAIMVEKRRALDSHSAPVQRTQLMKSETNSQRTSRDLVAPELPQEQPTHEQLPSRKTQMDGVVHGPQAGLSSTRPADHESQHGGTKDGFSLLSRRIQKNDAPQEFVKPGSDHSEDEEYRVPIDNGVRLLKRKRVRFKEPNVSANTMPRFHPLVEDYESTTTAVANSPGPARHVHKKLDSIRGKLATFEQSAVLIMYRQAIVELEASQVGEDLGRDSCSLAEFWRGQRPPERNDTTQKSEKTPLSRVGETTPSGTEPPARSLDHFLATIRATHARSASPLRRQRTTSKNSAFEQISRDADDQPLMNHSRGCKVIQRADVDSDALIAPRRRMDSLLANMVAKKWSQPTPHRGVQLANSKSSSEQTSRVLVAAEQPHEKRHNGGHVHSRDDQLAVVSASVRGSSPTRPADDKSHLDIGIDYSSSASKPIHDETPLEIAVPESDQSEDEHRRVPIDHVARRLKRKRDQFKEQQLQLLQTQFRVDSIQAQLYSDLLQMQANSSAQDCVDRLLLLLEQQVAMQHDQMRLHEQQLSVMKDMFRNLS